MTKIPLHSFIALGKKKGWSPYIKQYIFSKNLRVLIRFKESDIFECEIAFSTWQKINN